MRTQHVGHLRDVRRLIVTMSRARFGLYVFGRLEDASAFCMDRGFATPAPARFSLFENCFELTPVFSRFAKLPRELSLELLGIFKGFKGMCVKRLSMRPKPHVL